MKGAYYTTEEKAAIVIKESAAESAISEYNSTLTIKCPHCGAPLSVSIPSVAELKEESKLYKCGKTMRGKKGCGKQFFVKVGTPLEIVAAKTTAYNEEYKEERHRIAEAASKVKKGSPLDRLNERMKNESSDGDSTV